MPDGVDAAPAETKPAQAVAFRDARWKTQWLIFGLAGLLLWRCLSFVDREWLARFPWWLFVIVAGAVPQFFLLLLPIVTRIPHQRRSFGLPPKARCVVEVGIAIPVTIATVIVLGVVNNLVNRLSPGTSLTPDAIKNMAVSPNRVYVCVLLLFSCTLAPIAEEVFFRGFLYNALRARMPRILAGFVQCLIFGFGHFFGTTHAVVAVALGALLTAIYEWRKTLVTPIAVHAGINLVAALGLAAAMIAHADRPELGVVGDPEDVACVIRQVKPDSAAAAAGLQVNDTVTAINGEPIRDFRHLAERIRLCRVGDVVRLEVSRAGRALEVKLVLGKRERP